MFGIQIQEYPMRTGWYIIMPSYERIRAVEEQSPLSLLERERGNFIRDRKFKGIR